MMTAYQKRVKERDEARNEVCRLSRLIHDLMLGTPRIMEMSEIAMQVQILDEVERMVWQGEIKNENDER